MFSPGAMECARLRFGPLLEAEDTGAPNDILEVGIRLLKDSSRSPLECDMTVW